MPGSDDAPFGEDGRLVAMHKSGFGESVRDVRPSTDDSVVEAMDEEAPPLRSVGFHHLLNTSLLRS